MADKFPLPKKLQITPDKQEQIDQEQKEWAQRSPFASPSGLQMEQSNAAVFIRDMEQAIKDGFKADNALKSRMAESYAILGHYQKSVQLESDKLKRREYLEILEAIDRDDTEECNCETQKGDLELATQFVKKDVWSPKHNRIMPLVVCMKCGHANVRTLPTDLRKLREARRKAVSIKGSHQTTKQVLK